MTLLESIMTVYEEHLKKLNTKIRDLVLVDPILNPEVQTKLNELRIKRCLIQQFLEDLEEIKGIDLCKL